MTPPGPWAEARDLLRMLDADPVARAAAVVGLATLTAVLGVLALLIALVG